jgi:phage shock protein PspC (stress-responsive transcriptional regulator)
MASEPLTPPLVVIAGPTASGKTSLAIAIAKQFNGEIICADSRTIYKGMDIGTAKPTPEEQRAVAHWGLDLVEPGDEFNVAEKSPKRLMRDTHTGMLGGVCAGIAEYFRIDAVIVRIIAIILMLVSFGAVCFVYVVLWLIVPKATTAADRLQMAGAPVTLDGIKEVAARTPDSDGRMKPLLVLLRVLLVLLFAGMAVGMLVVIVMATVFGVPVISEMTPHFRATGWGIGALTAGVLSGALFVVLMGLLIYMVVVWRTSKRIGVMAGTITLVGLGDNGVGIWTGGTGGNRISS